MGSIDLLMRRRGMMGSENMVNLVDYYDLKTDAWRFLQIYLLTPPSVGDRLKISLKITENEGRTSIRGFSNSFGSLLFQKGISGDSFEAEFTWSGSGLYIQLYGDVNGTSSSTATIKIDDLKVYKI